MPEVALRQPYSGVRVATHRGARCVGVRAAAPEPWSGSAVWAFAYVIGSPLVFAADDVV